MDLKQFTNNNRFLMLALDHRGSFKKYISQNPEAVTDGDVVKAKRMIIGSLTDLFSGVLIDPAFVKTTAGKPSYADKPYLLCLEKTGYVENDSERITELEYTAEQLKALGASGTKLLLYFNPEAKNCEVQMATAKEALADSHRNDLPFFLEIVTYGNEAAGKGRAEWVKRSVKMLLANSIVPDVWKLEFPDDLESCQEVTKLAQETPWILLTRGESFDVFKEQLRVAVAAGAVGFLAGRALWQEFGQYPDEVSQNEFLIDLVRPRFEEISRIVLV